MAKLCGLPTGRLRPTAGSDQFRIHTASIQFLNWSRRALCPIFSGIVISEQLAGRSPANGTAAQVCLRSEEVSQGSFS